MKQVDKYRLFIVGMLIFILLPITVTGFLCSKLEIIIISNLIIISLFIIDVKYLTKLEEDGKEECN